MLALAGGAVAVYAVVTGTGLDQLQQLVIYTYVVAWPLYVALYVGWTYWAYSRLSPASLQRAGAADNRDDQRPILRFLGITGTTNTTISATVIAVYITVVIAQGKEFRTEPLYIGLILLAVASSWILMAFSFAQSYLRLGAAPGRRAHFRFSFPGAPRFSDYITLAVTISTMAVAAPAEVTSREAWRVVRTNVVIAFVFNTVIIAMMVSVVFGGLLG